MVWCGTIDVKAVPTTPPPITPDAILRQVKGSQAFQFKVDYLRQNYPCFANFLGITKTHPLAPAPQCPCPLLPLPRLAVFFFTLNQSSALHRIAPLALNGIVGLATLRLKNGVTLSVFSMALDPLQTLDTLDTLGTLDLTIAQTTTAAKVSEGHDDLSTPQNRWFMPLERYSNDSIVCSFLRNAPGRSPPPAGCGFRRGPVRICTRGLKQSGAKLLAL